MLPVKSHFTTSVSLCIQSAPPVLEGAKLGCHLSIAILGAPTIEPPLSLTLPKARPLCAQRFLSVDMLIFSRIQIYFPDMVHGSGLQVLVFQSESLLCKAPPTAGHTPLAMCSTGSFSTLKFQFTTHLPE